VEDFPRTLLELEKRYSTEDACREYLDAPRAGRQTFDAASGRRSSARKDTGNEMKFKRRTGK
jgi:hypothetical protein